MDTRAFLGLALLCLCMTSVYGVTSNLVITSDKMIDDTTRKVVIGFRITASSESAGEYPRVCSGSLGAITTITGVTATVSEGTSSACDSDETDCDTDNTVTFAFSPSFCASGQFQGTAQITYDHCADATPTVTGISANIEIKGRDVCSNSQASVSAAIAAFGPYANSGFSEVKNPYYIGDVVYFPFKVTYTGLSIAKVTFNTISVTEGSSSPVYLYTPVDAAPTAAGSAVQLATQPISQLNSGTATVWFSIKLTRDDLSPFASALSPDTLYKFDVVFDVVYKNAKRNLEGRDVEEGKKISSRAYIRVSDQVPPTSEVLESHTLITNAAYHTVQAGLVVVLFSIILALF